jgi:hypothetical protein
MMIAPPQITARHITDLLENSIRTGPHAKEPNKMRQIIELYKRSIKSD